MYIVDKEHVYENIRFDVAVFQVCSEELSEEDWIALYYGDTGPNITSLQDKNGNSNWMFYVKPK